MSIKSTPAFILCNMQASAFLDDILKLHQASLHIFNYYPLTSCVSIIQAASGNQTTFVKTRMTVGIYNLSSSCCFVA